ncbi:hypothetical protein [Methanobrevibacter boviskoreani]|nr:hypothetical protein [Methanobrevibacter boviskoreani]
MIKNLKNRLCLRIDDFLREITYEYRKGCRAAERQPVRLYKKEGD